MTLLHGHHGEIEYDLRRIGVDLLDFWRGTLSLRALIVYVERMLRDRTTALVRALAPDTAAWGETEYLLAELIDLGRGHFQNPKRYPRPGEAEAAAAALDARRARFDARQAKRRNGGA